MNWAVILLLTGLLTANELLGAYYGAAGEKTRGQRWMVYTISLLAIIFVYMIARQIGTVIKRF